MSDFERMSLEEQFASFAGQVRVDGLPDSPVATQTPTAPAAGPEPVAAPAPEPIPVEAQQPQPPVEPAPVVAVAPPPAPQVVETPQTDSLLADFDKATESLSALRAELVRVMDLQNSTAAELGETRRQLAALDGPTAECIDCKRLEGELAHQRSLVSAVRTKLGEVVGFIDSE